MVGAQGGQGEMEARPARALVGPGAVWVGDEGGRDRGESRVHMLPNAERGEGGDTTHRPFAFQLRLTLRKRQKGLDFPPGTCAMSGDNAWWHQWDI